MIQNLDWNELVNNCRYGNAWIRKPDGDVSFITCEPVYVYSVLLILRYGYRNFGSVCPVLGKRGIKRTVERILGLAERISLIVSLIFFVISFTMPVTVMKIFTNSPDTIAAGSEYLKVISFSFMFMGFSLGFYERSSKY